jgi:hypothetical protein
MLKPTQDRERTRVLGRHKPAVIPRSTRSDGNDAVLISRGVRLGQEQGRGDAPDGADAGGRAECPNAGGCTGSPGANLTLTKKPALGRLIVDPLIWSG